MKKIFTLALFFLIYILPAKAQTTYLPLGTDEYHLLDRLETFSGSLNNNFVSTLKPISRKAAVDFLLEQKRGVTFGATALSDIDQFNIARALSISGEWSATADGDDGAAFSKRPVLKYFYQRQPDLLHVNTDDFFMVVNPVMYLQAAYERNYDGVRYINTRGAEVRGRILGKIGFYTMFTDNQEKLPSYMSRWEDAHQAMPGNDYYVLRNKDYNDYLMAKGYFDFSLLKEHLNVTFGYDKNFMGDGMRSLFLSDVGAAATFLRLRSKFWKLNYENLFMELTSDYVHMGDRILPKKYATMHQLNINATRWLNVGIFESTIFSKEKFNFAYLVPVIFYRTVAQAVDETSNKTALGLNFKAIAFHTVQVYGQGYFNSVDFSTIGNGGWKNQYGFQLGAKYFNAFTLPNLDLQGELNVVRPFTYASSDTVSDYTHYNQALAHPMEASFAELIGMATYQPIEKLNIAAKAIYTARGTGSPPFNYGNNIFLPFANISTTDYYRMTSGIRLKSIYLNLNISYEIRPNIYVEIGGTHLRGKYYNGAVMPSSTLLYGALRWNIARKEYDYF